MINVKKRIAALMAAVALTGVVAVPSSSSKVVEPSTAQAINIKDPFLKPLYYEELLIPPIKRYVNLNAIVWKDHVVDASIGPHGQANGIVNVTIQPKRYAFYRSYHGPEGTFYYSMELGGWVLEGATYVS